MKENLVRADGQQVLNRLDDVPIYYWSAIGHSALHLGPMAQDFYAAFGLGDDDKAIATIDLDGVALAAIQGLHAENQSLRAQVDNLEQRLGALEALVQEGAGGGP
jgi:hypothetical protein